MSRATPLWAPDFRPHGTVPRSSAVAQDGNLEDITSGHQGLDLASFSATKALKPSVGRRPGDAQARLHPQGHCPRSKRQGTKKYLKGLGLWILPQTAGERRHLQVPMQPLAAGTYSGTYLLDSSTGLKTTC